MAIETIQGLQTAARAKPGDGVILRKAVVVDTERHLPQLSSEYNHIFIYSFIQQIFIVPLGRWDDNYPKVHVLIPETCEYVTLPGKKGLADVFKDLKIGRYPGLSSWVQYNLGVIKRGKQQMRLRDGTIETEVQVMRDSEPRNTGRL